MWHCTKCVKEFKALYSTDDEVGDESYEVCPHCLNDFDLGDGPLPDHLKPAIPVVKIIEKGRIWRSKDEWEVMQEEKESKEDEKVRKYQELYEREGKEVADKMFNQL